MGTLQQAHTIHFSGIGGIGMSALAQLLKADGKTVAGSDIAQNTVTERMQRLGIPVTVGEQTGAAIDSATQLLVHTSAMPADHPELVVAREQGIPTLTYFEAVGEYMQEFEHAIAISGTHGKSTTTAMIAQVLMTAGLNPTIIVGSIMKEFGSNAHHGGKEYIIVEACEYQEQMMALHPNMIVMTNIEEDHLDYYRDLDHIVMTFQKYINQLPSDGVLFKNLNDSESTDLGCDSNIVLYGDDPDTEHSLEKLRTEGQHQTFTSNGTKFTLNVPGKFNALNALAAISVGRYLGIDESVLQEAIASFRGIWRRFEVLGEYRDAIVISDYAHHPTAVHSTIKAAREFYPKRRIVVVFQPHQHDRTEKLFDQFVQSFEEADLVMVQEIYDVAGRESGEHTVTGQDIVDRIEADGKYAMYCPDVVSTRQHIDDFVEPGDVVLIMGAGDIYTLAETLVQ